MKQARLEYLNTENLVSKERVQENDKSHDRLLRVKQGKYEQKKLLKELTQRYEVYERHQKEKQSYDASKEFLSTSAADSTTNFNKATAAQQESRVSQQKQNNVLINPKTSKRIFHPNSKILIVDPERQKDFLGLAPNIVDSKLKQRQNEDPKEFELHIHSAPNLKQRGLFSRYYTGGPLKCDYESTSVN